MYTSAQLITLLTLTLVRTWYEEATHQDALLLSHLLDGVFYEPFHHVSAKCA